MNRHTIAGTGLIPPRITDLDKAFGTLQIDGAVIIELGLTGPEVIMEATRRVLGDHLRAMKPSIGIVTNPVVGEGPHPDAERRNVLADRSVQLDLHIDGYMQFGTCYPDFIFLLCAEQAPEGGESFAVDGVRLVDRLAEDPDERDLVDFLWRVPIDQTTLTGVPHEAPVAGWTPGGRATARRHEKQRLLEGRENQLHRDFLDRWAVWTQKAAEVAPRFLLQPGDLLCLDNYRVFHGRGPYEGLGRTMHRVWAWTDLAFGVPDNPAWTALATKDPTP